MMVVDWKTGGLVLHVLLCASLWYSVFCRAVREDKHVKVVVRLAFALLGMAALCAMVAPLVWGWRPDPVTLLLVLSMVVVQFVTAAHWRGGVPQQYVKDNKESAA